MLEISKSVFENKKLRFGLILVAIVLLLIVVFRRETQRAEIKPPADLEIGVSSLDDVVEAFGEPEIKDEKFYLFDSSSLTRKNIAVISLEKKLSFFIEVATDKDGRSMSEFQKIYGPAPYLLYNELAGGGYVLYAYPEEGIAFIGKAATDSVLEVWYFPRTDYENFKQNYAQDYSEDQEHIHTL